MTPSKLAKIKARRDWITEEYKREAWTDDEADRADLLDHVDAQAKACAECRESWETQTERSDAHEEAQAREIRFCGGAIAQYKITEADLCKRGIALRDENARQRRAIYRLAAWIHEDRAYLRADDIGLYTDSLDAHARIRARLAAMEGRG